MIGLFAEAAGSTAQLGRGGASDALDAFAGVPAVVSCPISSPGKCHDTVVYKGPVECVFCLR
jgi:hypothetical protein